VTSEHGVQHGCLGLSERMRSGCTKHQREEVGGIERTRGEYLSLDTRNVNVDEETRTLHVFVDGGFVTPSCYPMMRQPIISDPLQPAQHKVSNLFTYTLWVN